MPGSPADHWRDTTRRVGGRPSLLRDEGGVHVGAPGYSVRAGIAGFSAFPPYTPATDSATPDSERVRSLDALLPSDIARAAEGVGVAKATMRFDRLFVLGVLAGAFIALGAMFSTVVTADGDLDPGLARLLAGIVFSLGLVLVVVAGAELFTGNNLMAIAFASGRIRLGALLQIGRAHV